jgi:hypothetical protein
MNHTVRSATRRRDEPVRPAAHRRWPGGDARVHALRRALADSLNQLGAADPDLIPSGTLAVPGCLVIWEAPAVYDLRRWNGM